nr:NUDIX domain-containing protein [uncultured Carboxylicivirga sp.]
MKEKRSTQPGDVIKYCPKCGSEEFIFDGSRSFKCNKCKFHFFINSSAAVAAVIVNEKGEVLLTRRAFDPGKGMLDLPGGFVDPMESAETAIRREIKEELNLDIDEMSYLVSYPNEYVFSGFSVYTTDLGFLCKVKNFEQMHVEDDISGYEFVKEKEIDYKQISSDSIANILKSYFQTQN